MPGSEGMRGEGVSPERGDEMLPGSAGMRAGGGGGGVSPLEIG